MNEPEPPKAEPEKEAGTAPAPAAAGANAVDVGSAPAAASSGEAPPQGRRLRPPTVFEAGAFVAMVAAIVGLVFKFAPGCEPQPSSPTTKATISDISTIRPVSFRRFLQRQQIPIPPDMTPQFLARKGVMVEFGYEIIGLSGKHLQLGWELSDNATNDLVDAEQSTFELVPSKNDDAGDWAVWIPAPRPGRKYYATVTLYKPEGPPYELKHFRSATFPGFAARSP